MKSEDDPEARIRELEQPLADTARTSEAVTPPPGKWTAPPPPQSYTPPPRPPLQPPPLPYGGSFPGPSPAPYSRSSRTWWIIAGVFVIGMIALPVAIFLFTAHQVSRSGLPTMFPTPIMPSNSPTGSATMPPTNATPPSMPTTVSTAPAGESITVSGISEARTIACNGGSVSVSGITNNVVITGHCASLSVSGIQNQITVDAVDTIQASGSGNQVTYHTGSPTIGNSGFGNVVQRG
jgi:hypothetical protein